MADPKPLRCAIYTRKSSEEGLEQSFNSLHAQREACEAYILSQKHEGWQLVPTAYDDGGFSGGSMNRPALQALLGDVAAGLVDIIVVYKVDRLTRSLADFAKMVEAFDARSVSFVSVTQAFNTTTSMGRLTLNVLLSFAQFEREVTGERIRDKIAASKAKGMWMGGVVPLGNDVGDRALVVNEPEAAQVRELFARYLDLGSADAVVEHAARAGIRSKQHTAMTGVHRGGGRITRGSLYRILANPLYAGLVAHGGKLYVGQHAAIVSRETWDTVQAKLAGNRRKERGTRTTTDRRHALAGRIQAGDGSPLRATHTRHGTKRYDYYVGGSVRIAAAALDTIVADAIADHVAEPARLAATLLTIEPPTASHVARGKRLALQLGSDERADALRTAVERVVVDQDKLTVTLAPSALATSSAITLTITTSIARREQRLSIIVPGIQRATPDPALVRTIAQARGWFAELAAGKTPSIEAIAERDRVSPTYVSTWLPAAFIAPRIVQMIAHGEQPVWLTRQKLRTMLPLPHGWEDQGGVINER